MDIAFVSFLPAEFFPQRASLGLDAVVLLEQVTPGKFVRHTLETETCNHLTCAAGDVDGDGRPELVVGNYVRSGRPGGSVAIWRNTTGKQVGAARSTRTSDPQTKAVHSHAARQTP